MKRVLKIAGEGIGGEAISNSTMHLVVQDYWRKLGYPGTLRDNGQRPKKCYRLKSPHKKLSQREHSVTNVDY